MKTKKTNILYFEGAGAVAAEISRLRSDVRVLDALEVEPHRGMHEAKKRGEKLPVLMMRVICDLPTLPICVIDNVIDTGTTFAAARAALGESDLYAVATTKSMP